MRTEIYQALHDAIESEKPAASATILDGDEPGQQIVFVHPDVIASSLADPAMEQAIVGRLREATVNGSIGVEEIAGQQVFVEAHLPPPHLVIVGAVHIAIPMVTMAQALGYKTTVIDARGIFATGERFPHTDSLIEAWPDEGLEQINLHPGVAAVVLAHDEKFEDPALEVLLRSDVGYIGAIGSRKTSQARLERLRRYGFTDEQLNRIHGPVGLDLGGRAPAEIALSILAEIVAVKHGRDPSEALAAAKSA